MASQFTDLISQLQQLTASAIPSKGAVREDLLQAAQQLVRRLETPAERITRLGWYETTLPGTVRVLIDLKVFEILAASDKPMKVADLAKQSGADANLLGRLLKHAATDEFVTEAGPDEYTASDVTRDMATPAAAGMIRDVFHIVKMVDALPKFLKKTNYQNPTDNKNGPFQFSYDTDQHYFTYVNSTEALANDFMLHMQYKTIGLKWYEDDRVMEGIFGAEKFSAEDVRIVDLGGADGYDLLGFKKAHPDLPGRLVLQDLPTVINALDTKALEAKGVEAMPHDMLTPQPVEGAKVYYMKMVLHDWPVGECRQALANLKPVLKSGYSRILLNEFVISDQQASWFETSLDMLMMMTHAAQERKEREWQELVNSVGGLKVIKFWDVQGAGEKIIEIGLA